MISEQEPKMAWLRPELQELCVDEKTQASNLGENSDFDGGYTHDVYCCS